MSDTDEKASGTHIHTQVHSDTRHSPACVRLGICLKFHNKLPFVKNDGFE